MDAICDDLDAEHTDLDALVAAATEADLERPTPAEGWAVRDQISHLWFFDQRAVMAVRDADAFEADKAVLLSPGADPSVAAGRALGSGAALIEAWRAERHAMVAVLRALDPKARIPWYGPAMGARSFATARLMETWAHGQDVADALGVVRAPTDRLRHVAHIGVGARPFSYATNGRPMPDGDIRVELTGPHGDTWTWGPADAADVVSGPALDFCLVVTQRRHVDDTSLVVKGPLAADWIAIAQAFAGGPGTGRRPGQFA
jgi:uncharacterized protein (TIGR03084 family)